MAYHVIANMLLIDSFHLIFKYLKVLNIPDAIVNIRFDLFELNFRFTFLWLENEQNWITFSWQVVRCLKNSLL